MTKITLWDGCLRSQGPCSLLRDAIHTRTYTYICTHTQTHTYILTHTCKYIRTNTYIHIHTHKYTHRFLSVLVIKILHRERERSHGMRVTTGSMSTQTHHHHPNLLPLAARRQGGGWTHVVGQDVQGTRAAPQGKWRGPATSGCRARSLIACLT